MNFFLAFKNFICSHYIKFTKYCIIGFMAFLFDITFLAAMKEIFSWRPFYTVFLSQSIILAFVFLMNKYWTFSFRPWQHQQIIRFLALSGWNYLFSGLAMLILNERLDIHYLIVRVVSIVLIVTWDFLAYRYWVYR